MLGFMLSCISVQGLFKGYAVISIAVPFLILALPIFDTASAIIRRVKKGQPIMSPDRNHLHHRLVDAGLSQKKAVTLIYFVSIVLCMIAIILIATGAVAWWVLLLVVLAFLAFLSIGPKMIEGFTDKHNNSL